MLYFITPDKELKPQIVSAASVKDLKIKYPGYRIYVYKETRNPVTQENSDRGYSYGKRMIIPAMEKNKYCVFI